MRPFLVAAVLLCLSVRASAGQVRVVDIAPAPYARIQDAVNAAQPGDVILVRSAPHDSLRIAGKGLAVVADVGVGVQEAGAIRITGLGARSLVVLSGITATGIPSTAIPELAHGLFADANAGAVLVQDCSLSGWSGVTSCERARSGAFVRASAAVSFTRCTLRGGAVSNLDAGVDVGQAPGLDCVGSANVTCDDADLLGGSLGAHCNTPNPGDGAWGGDGARLAGGWLFTSGSIFRGGTGGDVTGFPCTPFTLGGGGGDGLRAFVPSFCVRLDTSAFGGFGGLSCGLVGQGPMGQAVSGVSISNLPGTARRLGGSPLVRDDELATLTFRGVSGERVELAVALGQAVLQYDALQSGVRHVRAERWRTVGVVPASGTLTASFKLPNLSLADPGAILVTQARFIDPATSQVRLSNAHAIVEVDASY